MVLEVESSDLFLGGGNMYSSSKSDGSNVRSKRSCRPLSQLSSEVGERFFSEPGEWEEMKELADIGESSLVKLVASLLTGNGVFGGLQRAVCIHDIFLVT